MPHDPYTALWSRLAGLDPNELGRALVDRTVVRLAVMRSTIHLVTADDALLLRPLVQPVLAAGRADPRYSTPQRRGSAGRPRARWRSGP